MGVKPPFTVNTHTIFWIVVLPLAIVISIFVALGRRKRIGPLMENSSAAARNTVLGVSLAAPATMVLLTRLLPRTGDPLHPADNAWYFALTAWVCVAAMVAAAGALVLGMKNGAWAAVALAALSILLNLAVGFFAFFLWSIRGLHT